MVVVPNPTINGTVKTPAGAVCPSAQVVIRLVSDGYRSGQVAAADYSMAGETVITANSLGVWSAVLQPNSDINPGGSQYEALITPSYGVVPIRTRFVVPVGAGPFRFEDLAVTSLVDYDFGYGGF